MGRNLMERVSSESGEYADQHGEQKACAQLVCGHAFAATYDGPLLMR